MIKSFRDILTVLVPAVLLIYLMFLSRNKNPSILEDTATNTKQVLFSSFKTCSSILIFLVGLASLATVLFWQWEVYKQSKNVLGLQSKAYVQSPPTHPPIHTPPSTVFTTDFVNEPQIGLLDYTPGTKRYTYQVNLRGRHQVTVKIKYGLNLEHTTPEYTSSSSSYHVLEVSLPNLEQNHIYQYQVLWNNGSGYQNGPVFTFRTPRDWSVPFRFGVWGDNRQNAPHGYDCKVGDMPAPFNQIINSMTTQGYDFTLSVGDDWDLSGFYDRCFWHYALTNPAQRQEYELKSLQSLEFYRDDVDIFHHSVPHFVSVGNHEFDVDYLRQGNADQRINKIRTNLYVKAAHKARLLSTIYPLNHDPNDNIGDNGSAYESYYAFEWGNALFVALNDSMERTFMSAQYQWLQNVLTSSNAQWKVVFFHRPAKYGKNGNFCDSCMDYEFIDEVRQLLSNTEVDVAFQGHQHDYYCERYDFNNHSAWDQKSEWECQDNGQYGDGKMEWNKQDGETTVLYLTTGGAGAPTPPEYQYMDVEVSETQLKLRCINRDGNPCSTGAFGIPVNQIVITKSAAPPPGPALGSTIEIRASGTQGAGVYPTMQLLIDDTVVSTFANVGPDLNIYTYSHPSTVGPTQVKVKFINDYYAGSGNDRNLRVDKITIDGQDYESEYAYSTGTWSSDTQCAPGHKFKEWLHCNGYFDYGLVTGSPPTTPTPTPPPSGSTITIHARGTQGGGVYPTMQLLVDDVVVRTYTDIGPNMSTYTYIHGSVVRPGQIKVKFTNDYYAGPGNDRNLIVDKIVVDDWEIESELDAYSTGTWPHCGTYWMPGSEWLQCTGYFHYVGGISINPPPLGPFTSIAVHAQGTAGGGVYPTMQLLVDDVVVKTFTNVGATMRAYEHVVPAEDVSPNQVKVKFINDYYGGTGNDRNLRVDKITINGQDYESEANDVYSTGTWSADTACAPGYKNSEWLHCNGYFHYGVAYTGTHIGLSYTADANCPALTVTMSPRDAGPEWRGRIMVYDEAGTEISALDNYHVPIGNDCVLYWGGNATWPYSHYKFHGTKEQFRQRGLPRYIKVKIFNADGSEYTGFSSVLDLGDLSGVHPTPNIMDIPGCVDYQKVNLQCMGAGGNPNSMDGTTLAACYVKEGNNLKIHWELDFNNVEAWNLQHGEKALDNINPAFNVGERSLGVVTDFNGNGVLDPKIGNDQHYEEIPLTFEFGGLFATGGYCMSGGSICAPGSSNCHSVINECGFNSLGFINCCSSCWQNDMVPLTIPLSNYTSGEKPIHVYFQTKIREHKVCTSISGDACSDTGEEYNAVITFNPPFTGTPTGSFISASGFGMPRVYAVHTEEGRCQRIEVQLPTMHMGSEWWNRVKVFDSSGRLIGDLKDYHVDSGLCNTYYGGHTFWLWPRSYYRFHGTKEQFRARGLPQYIKVKLYNADGTEYSGFSSIIDLGLDTSTLGASKSRGTEDRLLEYMYQLRKKVVNLLY